ncbi:MAG: hypothetical protein MJ211_15105 [Bacteroidales bacterium]|nr:hypothetical protein [Bacteroidales bacterium]
MKKLSTFVEKNFNALETICAILVVLSLFNLIYNIVPYSLYICYSTLGLLALIYWAMAVRPFEKKVSMFRLLERRIVWISYILWSLSLCAKLHFNDQDYTSFYIITIILLFLGLIFIFLKRFVIKDNSDFVSTLTRSLIFLIISFWLLAM